MKRLSDDAQLLRDMQLHPDRYTDEQLEAMMSDLDREPDAEASWMKFIEKEGTRGREQGARGYLWWAGSYRRTAAAAIFVALAIGMGCAARFVFTALWERSDVPREEEQQAMPKPDALPVDTLYRFDGVRLDSIMLRVGSHYGREVVFRDTASAALRLFTMWNSTRPISEFMDILSEFDNLTVSTAGDTLVIESTTSKAD